MTLVDSIVDILSIILDGISSLIDFILYLPSLIHSLLIVLPEPFYTIVTSFIGIIILIVLLFTCARVVSAAKGG